MRLLGWGNHHRILLGGLGVRLESPQSAALAFQVARRQSLFVHCHALRSREPLRGGGDSEYDAPQPLRPRLGSATRLRRRQPEAVFLPEGAVARWGFLHGDEESNREAPREALQGVLTGSGATSASKARAAPNTPAQLPGPPQVSYELAASRVAGRGRRIGWVGGGGGGLGGGPGGGCGGAATPPPPGARFFSPSG